MFSFWGYFESTHVAGGRFVKRPYGPFELLRIRRGTAHNICLGVHGTPGSSPSPEQENRTSVGTSIARPPSGAVIPTSDGRPMVVPTVEEGSKFTYVQSAGSHPAIGCRGRRPLRGVRCGFAGEESFFPDRSARVIEDADSYFYIFTIIILCLLICHLRLQRLFGIMRALWNRQRKRQSKSGGNGRCSGVFCAGARAGS